MQKRYRALPLVACALTVVSFQARAQERVQLDLVAGFAEGLPFEVPLLLVGRAPAGVEALEFRYRPEAGEDPGYLPVAPVQGWARTLGDGFAFEVWPLHPGTRYRFELQLQLNVGALERHRPGVVARVGRLLRGELSRWLAAGGLQLEDRQALEARVVATLFGDVGDRVLPGIGRARSARLPAAELDALVALALEQEAVRLEFAANHAPSCDALVDALGPGGEAAVLLAPIRAQLDGLERPGDGSSGGPPVLDTTSERRWSRVLDPRDRINGTAVSEAAGLLLWLHEEPGLLADLLAGRRTIHRTTLLPTDEGDGSCAAGGADLPSVAILADLLHELTGLRTDRGALLTPERARIAATLARELRAYRDDARRLLAGEQGLAAALEAGVERMALETSVSVVAVATEVPARSHPYVGMDLGAAWAGGVDGPVLYTAAQLYAVPVNRSARLAVHRRSDVLLKRLSLMAGLAVTGVEDDAAGRSDLWGLGSPMLGVGLRLTPGLRASGGALWFRETDPADGEERTARTWFASLAVDLDLRALLGRIGRLFGD